MVQGLTQIEATKRLHKYGHNVLPSGKRHTKLSILISQLMSPLIYILIFAAAVTLFLRDITDTVVILAAVVINTILGFYQEVKAEESLSALNSMLHPTAKVNRDGSEKDVDAELLVPSDVVVVHAGYKVPADGVLVEAVSLTVDESMLTGESVPISKNAHAGKIRDKDFSKIPEEQKLYMGTIVLSGRGVFKVTATGATTKMGMIASSLASVSDEKTPLQKKLASLAQVLAYIVAGISLLVFFVGLATGNSLVEMFTTSVAIAVAAIPEGMVVTLTVILAIGMQKILKKKALVRKLIAAETLGSVTVIATDKTGTLTEGKMRVSKTQLKDEQEAAKICVFANNLEDPLEFAIWEWSEKMGVDPEQLRESHKRDSEVPFSSETKFMSTSSNGYTYVKGAPEVVMGMCVMSVKRRQRMTELFQKWSESGLRVIGLASGKKKKKLRFAGLIGIEDPVRADVSSVLNRCRRAGIRAVMVTGDYLGTAMAIWKKIKRSSLSSRKIVIDGAALLKLSDDDLCARVGNTEVFARVAPDQKLQIVNALQKNGEVVALMGDGVNDAPAIKQANIGIVVGEASDVAKETADMVLLDSNFNTILAAIEEGRNIFNNIRKVILYLLSDSFSEVVLITLSLILGIPLPVTAAQILWINLITDGFPNLALTIEPKEKGLMSRPPLAPNTPIMDTYMKFLIIFISTITGIASLLLFIYYSKVSTLEHARTVAFTLQGIDSLVYVFSIRSLREPLWAIRQFSNPYLILAVACAFFLQLIAIYHPFFQKFLHTRPLYGTEWAHIVGALLIIVGLIEGVKLILARSKTLS